MSKIEFFGQLVGVERITKAKKKDENSLFVDAPEIADDYGVVSFIGSGIQNAGFSIGDRVYFGKNRQELRMAGKDILVMEANNVIAKVTEESSPA